MQRVFLPPDLWVFPSFIPFLLYLVITEQMYFRYVSNGKGGTQLENMV